MVSNKYLGTYCRYNKKKLFSVINDLGITPKNMYINKKGQVRFAVKRSKSMPSLKKVDLNCLCFLIKVVPSLLQNV